MTRRFIAALVMMTALAGCASGVRRESSGAIVGVPTTQPEPAPTTKPERPMQTVVSADFDALWDACDHAARARLFPIERTDYRAGVLVTRPVVSKQFFEFWRNDVVTAPDLAESSLATIRRTLRFDITPTSDGKFRATPSVLVERYSNAERRVTSATVYRSLFRRQAVRASGTRESDRGVYLPGRYWYEIGHDEALERELRESVVARLKHHH